MSKDKVHQFEHPMADEAKSSRAGMFAVMAVLGIVGLVMWMIFGHGDK